MTEQTINLTGAEQISQLFGYLDKNIRLIEEQYSVQITLRDGILKVSGDADDVDLAVRAIQGVLLLIEKGEAVNDQSIRYIISLVGEGSEKDIKQLAGNDCICVTVSGKPVKPKTLGRKNI